MKNKKAIESLKYYFDNNKGIHIGTEIKLQNGKFVFYNGFIIFLKEDHLWMKDNEHGDIKVNYSDIFNISEFREKEN